MAKRVSEVTSTGRDAPGFGSFPSFTVLGAGAIVPRAGYGPAGYVLRPRAGGGVVLIDCGPGSIRSLDAIGVGVHEVRAVVVTHFHLDHWLDLFALAFARRNPRLSEVPPLELLGPKGLRKRLDGVAGAIGRGAAFDDTTVREVEVTAGVSRVGPLAAFADVELSCAPTHHTDTSLAWRADLAAGPAGTGAGPSVTFSGDAIEGTDLVELARGTSLFVCECSSPDDDPMPGHLTPTPAARMARDAAVERLLLTHFYPGIEPEEARTVAGRTYSGPIEIARDGLALALG